jgi:hypothetical protein
LFLVRLEIYYSCIKSAVISDGPQPWSQFYREVRCEARQGDAFRKEKA